MAGFKISVRRDKRRTASKEAVREYIHEQLKTAWRACIKAFIEAVMDSVHVDTGMSEASLYDLATNVRIGKFVLADAMARRQSPPHPAYVDLRGKVYPGVKKSIALGQQLGSNKKAYRILFGSPKSPNMVFEFKIMVFQYKFHEEVWQTLEYGKIAFEYEWDNQLAKYGKKFLDFLRPK